MSQIEERALYDKHIRVTVMQKIALGAGGCAQDPAGWPCEFVQAGPGIGRGALAQVGEGERGLELEMKAASRGTTPGKPISAKEGRIL
jgi:hypothetical protein